VQVLQKSIPQQIIVVGVLDDRRNERQPGGLRGSPTTLAHDQLELRSIGPISTLTCGSLQRLGRNGPHDHRL